MRLPRNGENRSGGEHPVGHDRPRTNGTNGAHPAGLSTRSISLPEPDPEDDEEPVDLVALQADDELINALASGLTVVGRRRARPPTDDHVAAILAAWKAEVDAEPIPDLVDLDTAVATVQAARRPSAPGPAPGPGRRGRRGPGDPARRGVARLLLGRAATTRCGRWPRCSTASGPKSVEAADRVEERIALRQAGHRRGSARRWPSSSCRPPPPISPSCAPRRVRSSWSRCRTSWRPRPRRRCRACRPTRAPRWPPTRRARSRWVRQITSPARTSEQSAPVEPASHDPGSSGATSPRQRPAGARTSAGRPADPRRRPAPAPATGPEPEHRARPRTPAARGAPTDGPSPEADARCRPEPAPDPVAPDGRRCRRHPAPAPEGAESIGATAADTSTTAPSPTS